MENKNDLNDIIKNLTQENEYLLEQIYNIQEELEKYYQKIKHYEEINSNKNLTIFIPEEARNALEENLKLRVLVAQQSAALNVERTNSLSTKLGKILINGVKNVSSFVAMSIKLRRIWKALEQSEPPVILGGKSFQKVIDTYKIGGTDAVEKLLNSTFLSSVMRANAYTALARYVKQTDSKLTATLARMAWETDPRPYRLKWLAFRQHEAYDAITAEALLDMLPSDINMTPSEKSHAKRIREESKQQRCQQVEKITKRSQVEISKLQEKITELKNISNNNREQQAESISYINKLKEEHKHQLDILNTKLNQVKKDIEIANQKVIQTRKENNEIKIKMELQKKESDSLSLQTALMMKNILNQFESNTDVLSRVMRIIMGADITIGTTQK